MRIGVGLSVPELATRGGKFSPASLFSGGTAGVWYDPSDYSTLFQDSAGTTPVTAVEQPVGKMLDKSGNGNHATQATAASRPVLRARYNLLTYSNLGNAVAGTPGTAPTDWVLVSTGGNLTSVVADSNSNNILTFDATASRCYLTYSYAVLANGTYNASATINSNSGVPFYQCFDILGTPAGATKTYYANETLVDGVLYTPAANDRLKIVLAVSTTAGTVTVRIGTGVGGSSTGIVAISKPDFRIGTSAGSYQRITTATSYATTGFLPYLALDGTDDSFATNSIDFTATNKMSVCAGVTKLSDAAAGMLVELSANTNLNNGAYFIAAPDTANTFYFASKGTAINAVSRSPFASPISAVLTLTSNIAAPSLDTRVNTVASATSTSTQGTGNYGNYPLYIGRRGGASLPFNGRIYQMVVCGKVLSASELAALESFTNARTGAY